MPRSPYTVLEGMDTFRGPKSVARTLLGQEYFYPVSENGELSRLDYFLGNNELKIRILDVQIT